MKQTVAPPRKAQLFRSKTLLTALTLSSLVMAGCSSDSDSDDDDADDHSETEHDSRGRLAVYHPDSSSVSILDLDDESVATLDTFAIAGGAPSIYASPDKRYAVLIQRADGVVSFIDSGLYTEDHGDHLHDYAEAPALLDTTISGSNPTHFTVQEEDAAIFFDAEEGIASSVTLLNEQSIGDGTTVTELVLENNMHGAARQVDDALFVTYRDPSITDTTLPDEVDRYSLVDGTAVFEHRYSKQCPGLHGNAAIEEVIAFGCTDGILAIDLSSEDYPATHLANPEAAWLMAEPVTVTTAPGEDSVSPVVTASGSEEIFYILETGGQQILAVDSVSGEALQAIALESAGSRLLWLGLSGEHDHDEAS